VDLKAAVGTGCGSQLAAVERHPFAHSGQPVSRTIVVTGAPRRWAAGVAHHQLELVGIDPHVYFSARRASVLDRVC
jgi:hypothetical protein